MITETEKLNTAITIITNEKDIITESLEAMTDEEIAKAFLYQLPIIEHMIKDVKEKAKAEMIKRKVRYEDDDNLLFIAPSEKEFVRPDDFLKQASEAKYNIFDVAMCMGKKSILPGKYKKFIEATGLESKLQTETKDTVEKKVKAVSKKFLTSESEDDE